MITPVPSVIHVDVYGDCNRSKSTETTVNRSPNKGFLFHLIRTQNSLIPCDLQTLSSMLARSFSDPNKNAIIGQIPDGLCSLTERLTQIFRKPFITWSCNDYISLGSEPIPSNFFTLKELNFERLISEVLVIASSYRCQSLPVIEIELNPEENGAFYSKQIFLKIENMLGLRNISVMGWLSLSLKETNSLISIRNIENLLLQSDVKCK